LKIEISAGVCDSVT